MEEARNLCWCSERCVNDYKALPVCVLQILDFYTNCV